MDVVVTGGSRGIGAGIVGKFERNGHSECNRQCIDSSGIALSGRISGMKNELERMFKKKS